MTGGAGAAIAALVVAGLIAIAVPPGARAAELAFDGCITGNTQVGPSGSGACEQIPSATYSGSLSGLGELGALALSGDGASLYGVSGPACYKFGCTSVGAIARFDINQGGLAYRDCTTGDTSLGPSGSGACNEIPSATHAGYNSGLAPTSIALSADGKSLYAGSSQACGELDCAGGNALSALDRDPGTGVLTWRDCITGDEASGPSGSGACEQIPSATPDGRYSGLDGVWSVVVSPDGNSLYAGTLSSIARFVRDPDTGALTYQGCITGSEGSGPSGSGACEQVSSGPDSGLGSTALTLSPDGKSLYSLGSTDVVRFARDPGTGDLRYRDCVAGDGGSDPSGSGGCREIPRAALFHTTSLVISSNGKWLYVGGGPTIARFARNPVTGALAYRGCFTGDPDPAGPCTRIGTGILGAVSLALSPDGRTLYAAGGATVSKLARDTTTGSLAFRNCVTGSTQLAPPSSGGCTRVPSASGDGDLSGLDDLRTVATPDGKSIYTASYHDAAVAGFAIAPQSSVTSGPRGKIRRRRAAFKFHSGKPSTFECNLTGRHVRRKLRGWKDCGTGSLSTEGEWHYRHLRPGRKTFRVRATDAAGTTDPTPAKRRWRIKR